jgi:ectoine hydroxylase-related dioxygenase (phytanoyl-CoA dioxygenase family)
MPATAEIPRFAADAAPADIASTLTERGCVVVEGLAPEHRCDALVEELQPWLNTTPTGADAFSGFRTRRTGALLARSDTACDFVADPTVLAIVDQALWPQKSSYQLHLTQVITMEPGSEAQELHRDHWCFDFFPIPAGTHVEVSTMWALTDFTEENGATRVVIDSHHTDGMPYADADAVAVSMAKGSVLLYTGATVHGGGANRTSEVRRGLNIDYTTSFLRQEENQYLSVPLDRVRQLPEPIQRLMGYSLGAFALGYVGDVLDPATVLR